MEPWLHARDLSVASAQHTLGEQGRVPFRVCGGTPLGGEVRPPICPHLKPWDLGVCHHAQQRGIQIAVGRGWKSARLCWGDCPGGPASPWGPLRGRGRRERSQGSGTTRQGLLLQDEEGAAGRRRQEMN